MVTNTTVKALNTAYMVKVPEKNKGSNWLTATNKTINKKSTGNAYKPPELQSKSKFAVIVTNQEKSQLASVATLPARPLMLIGRIYNANI